MRTSVCVCYVLGICPISHTKVCYAKLSSSLCYKSSTTLRPGDEFIVLGCDGIWDCLSNEECVKYIRDRIDSKTPREIGMEMLDEIVSADPRASQGIGGDNMTIMIVDLLPHSRSYCHDL